VTVIGIPFIPAEEQQTVGTVTGREVPLLLLSLFLFLFLSLALSFF